MKKTIAIAVAMIINGTVQAANYDLSATLRAPNQDGSNPDLIAGDIVPSSATGTFSGTLDTDNNVITDIVISVDGMVQSDLRNFGPNSTPFHLHLPNNGPGTFGFNVVDLVFGTDASAFTFNATGFTFERASVSILEEDQGAFLGLGIHPGNDVIPDRILEESFVLIHSTKDIFTNTVHPPQFPDGFPFGELRGEINAVSAIPVPAATWLFGSGLLGLVAAARRNA